MDILICIDDTDDFESRGTGEIAELISEGLSASGWAECGRVTRHQLLIHPDIAYTSHNSSMCFPAQIEPGALEYVTEWCQTTLAAESVSAADPGLCIAAVERVADTDALMGFGLSAKQRVHTKDEAYELANRLGVHLSEHGGTGIGVIGALAGAGLRLSGNDGRFKGKFGITNGGETITVMELTTYGVESARTMSGTHLAGHERIVTQDECKLVLLDGQAVLLVEATQAGAPAPWRPVDRKTLRSF